MKKRIIALLAAFFLLAALLTACGGKNDQPAPAPAPGADDVQTAPSAGETTPSVEPEKPTAPADPVPDVGGDEPADKQTEEQPEEQPVEVEASAQDPVEAEPEPEPEPEEPAPEPEPEPEDGNYTANVTLEGGTGRATVDSPAALRCEGGRFYAVIVWSSPNFDYMKVDGEKYLQTNTEGNSTFEIPVTAFDQPLAVIADTIAMSEPHEVEYTLTFDSASLQKQ